MPPPRLSRRELHVLDAGGAPELEQPRLRPLLVEVADARAEEAADLGPARRDHPPGEREPDADVELPERAPDAARHGELEPGDRAARAHDARELAQVAAGSST